jgi:predicted GIY-YIG superfamily endonuclease
LEISEELLTAGASKRGGNSKRQTELLGAEWPRPRGWEKSIIGKTISGESAKEFVRLVGSHLTNKLAKRGAPLNWCGAPEPVDIHLYVWALADGCIYVGLTDKVNVARRAEQHLTGKGAQWTRQHRPIQVLETFYTGTRDTREAEQMEDEVTIIYMLCHGIDKVRGGHFCCIKQELIEPQLRSRGVWEGIMLEAISRRVFNTNTQPSWDKAQEAFLDTALRYYDADAPTEQHDAVFVAYYRLTRYRYWRKDFAPGIGWEFWKIKGILPVLLSFKLGRPVGSGLASAYDVLAAALNRGQNGKHPLRRLFLLAWQTYQPPTTENQAAAVTRFMEYLQDEEGFDRQYDAFVSILFPPMRHLLR